MKGISSSVARKAAIMGSFEDMVGIGKLNIDKCLKKTADIQKQCDRYVGLVALLSKCVPVKKIGDAGELHIKLELNRYLAEISNYKRDNEVYIQMYLLMEERNKAKTLEPTEKVVDKDLLEKFKKNYNEIADSLIISEILYTCNYLVNYRGYLDRKNPQEDIPDTFIVKRSGLSFVPLFKCNFNFKYVYSHDSLEAEDRRFLINILAKLWEISYNLYEIIMTPDIDIEPVTNMIKSAVQNLRRHIPRCDEAMDKLENGVGILGSKFNEYYREYKVSKNTDIFLINYISDIQASGETTPKIAAQFKRIISFMNAKYSQTKMMCKKIGVPEEAPHNPVNAVLGELKERFEKLEEDMKRDGEFEEYAGIVEEFGLSPETSKVSATEDLSTERLSLPSDLELKLYGTDGIDGAEDTTKKLEDID